eukprot:TRINITY_DN14337_c0_g1_i1.p1 TRINITY_DN14337_c0_g1~~TRINITY_DN14337_c0_g1_i1.p1  ORF type:complete len:202 (-),score=40.30 TRINITY_DN14337_c0_g1_i1:27-632(-)
MVKLKIDSRFFSLHGFPPAFIQNTFLEFGPTRQVQLRRFKSAPAILQPESAPALLQREMPASSSHSKSAGVDDIQKAVAHSMQATACSTQMPASSAHSKLGGVDDIQIPVARRMQAVDEIHMQQMAAKTSSGTQLTSNDGHKERLHVLGLCHPCSYFTFKGDGCHKGQDCEFCHMCTNEEAKVGRRRIKKQQLYEKEKALR